jgi:hypothetical protein
MALVGVIAREPNPPGVDPDNWRRIVKEDPRLGRPLSRGLTNPFTQRATVHTPAETDATIHHQGETVGAISVSLSDEHALDVWARDEKRSEVEAVATSIAVELGGSYIPLE